MSSQLKTFHSALQTFNSLAPFVKFSHFTANQAIFEAVHGFDRVHIIDLDVMQGLQWPGLFHILASRAKKVSSVRLTGFGPSSELLAQTGSRLAQFAASLGLPFKFNPVEGKFGDMSELELSRIDFRANEATVVHCMHHKLYDIIGSNFGLLRVLSTVKPKLVTMVTQNIDIFETGSFLERFIETLHYYSAMFDALGEGLSRDNVLRHQVEQQLFGSEIRNILACDDVDGLNVSRRWGDNLSRFGFEPVSLSGSPAAQASLLLEMFPWKGYTLMEENGCLRLGWKGMSLLTASAWQPSNYSCVTNNSNIMGN
uniref:Scarecrow-like protein 23 n=2 Tax=Chenopodium quinoa TaxID=63459 RepID=A0A803N202_CHEQI